MSQHEKILFLLERSEWVCSSEFYASYIADPRTRLAELRKKGYVLRWRWCESHDHRKSKEWKLVSKPLAYEEVIVGNQVGKQLVIA